MNSSTVSRALIVAVILFSDRLHQNADIVVQCGRLKTRLGAASRFQGKVVPRAPKLFFALSALCVCDWERFIMRPRKNIVIYDIRV